MSGALGLLVVVVVGVVVAVAVVVSLDDDDDDDGVVVKVTYLNRLGSCHSGRISKRVFRGQWEATGCSN